jgi:hypothetical protein
MKCGKVETITHLSSLNVNHSDRIYRIDRIILKNIPIYPADPV